VIEVCFNQAIEHRKRSTGLPSRFDEVVLQS
jgi:hypothetical protein